MKKRKLDGRLKLHRETLCNLAGTHLRRAVGANPGDTTQMCDRGSDCACATDAGCWGESWQHTCGTVCDIPSWHC